MLLTIKERFTLASILPPEGNFLLMKRRRELFEALTHFTDEEKRAFGFVENASGGLNWSEDAAALEFEIEVGETMADHLKKMLKQWDEKGQLKDEHLSLYEKFGCV